VREIFKAEGVSLYKTTIDYVRELRWEYGYRGPLEKDEVANALISGLTEEEVRKLRSSY